MPFIAPGLSTQKKRKSESRDANPHANKRHTTARDVEYMEIESNNDTCEEKYWNVQWFARSLSSALGCILDYCRRAPQTKKHKIWDGDAILAVTSDSGGARYIHYDTERRLYGLCFIFVSRHSLFSRSI